MSTDEKAVDDPTIAQMNADLGAREECFALGGTIRRCRVCNDPTFGGPTLCERCGIALKSEDVDAFAGQWKVTT